MAKIILSSDEELMYLHQIDRIKELIPDIEVMVTNQPVIYTVQGQYEQNYSGEFKQFLKNNGLSYEHSVKGVISDKA